jgi:DNA ligase-1
VLPSRREGHVDIEDGEVVFVQGSGKEPYQLKNVGGVYSCTCPAWRNAGGPIDRRTCKHLKALRGADVEAARIGAPAGPAPATPASEPAEGPPVLLAHRWEDQDLTGWWMSEKLDGVRAYWDGARFLSRLGNEFLAPDWFVADLPPHPLDGELWLGRRAFPETVSVVRRADRGEAWRQLRFLVFDVPSRDEPFEDRVAWLHAELRAPHATPVTHARCEGVDHLRAELARVEALGGEGLMLRRPGSRYEVGRSTTLLKVKTFHDAEAVVVAHEPGKGRHAGRVGALVCALADGTRFSVGTGLSDAERASPPPPGAVITFRYQELTRDGVPRFPSYVGLAVDRAGATPVTAAPPPAPPPAPAAPPAAASEGAWRRFEVDGKFWAIRLDGASFTVRFGKLGTAGQEKTKAFADAATARREHDALVREKAGKGYLAVPSGQ